MLHDAAPCKSTIDCTALVDCLGHRWFNGLRGPGLLHRHRVSGQHPLSNRSRPDGDSAAETAAKHWSVVLRPNEISR